MGVKTHNRTYLTSDGDAPLEVKPQAVETKPQTEYDPLEMTRDRLSWLFDEEATRLVEEARKGQMGFHGDEDFVVGQDILESLGNDWSETIQNLQERFAADLADSGFDSDDAVETAEERIDSDEFIWAHDDVFTEKLRDAAAGDDIRYFDTWADAIATIGGFSESEVDGLLDDPTPYGIARFEAANRRGATREVLEALPEDALDGNLHAAFVELMNGNADEGDIWSGYARAMETRNWAYTDQDPQDFLEELRDDGRNRELAESLAASTPIAYGAFSNAVSGSAGELELAGIRVYDELDEVENGSVRVEIDDDPEGTKANHLIAAMGERGYTATAHETVKNDESTDGIVAFDLERKPVDLKELLDEVDERQAEIDAEEDFELRAAFGEGATVVNVFTGKTRTVGGKQATPQPGKVDLKALLAEAPAKRNDYKRPPLTAERIAKLDKRRDWDTPTEQFYRDYGQSVVLAYDFDEELIRGGFEEFAAAYEEKALAIGEDEGAYFDDVDLEAVAHHLWRAINGKHKS